MNWDRVEGNWKQLKGKVQTEWGKLTSDELDVIQGKRAELQGRLQERYGYAKDQAEHEIDLFIATEFGPAVTADQRLNPNLATEQAGTLVLRDVDVATPRSELPTELSAALAETDRDEIGGPV